MPLSTLRRNDEMKRMNLATLLAAWLVCGLSATALFAAPAPDALNYQGVLRDNAGAPLDGSFDMTFRFYDAMAGGSEVLFDEHLAAGTGAVTVDGGLFNVALGSGSVSDGGGVFPNDPYTSLSQVFRDFTDVWIEIQIGVEVLSPRIKVISAGHALNADNAGTLDGLAGAQFMRSDQDTTTTGSLTGADLRSNGDLFLNADAPSVFFDNFIYFNNDEWLQWDAGTLSFEFSDGLRVSDLSASSTISTSSSVQVGGNLRMNHDGPEGDGTIYFYNGGTAFGESIRWHETLGLFHFSANVNVNDNIYIGESVDATRSIFFFEDGVYNESITWNNGNDRFEFSDALRTLNNISAGGLISTDATTIIINDNGGNSDQQIEFYNNGSQAERFQWDTSAQQFEVSDDFFAFGNLDASGTKGFVQNHPYRDDLEIVYTALEGNEVTTFTRGTARLVGGETTIALEESFRHVTNPDFGLSVHLTPRGGTAVLYTDNVSTSELVVRSDDAANAAFDFIVYGLRIGFEERPVYRPKRAEAFLPLPGAYDEEIAAEPQRVQQTAAWRYARMHEATFGTAPIENGAADTLRQSIGMRESNLDFPAGSDVSVREMNRIAVENGTSEDEAGEIATDLQPASDLERADGAGSGPDRPAEVENATSLVRDSNGDVYARSFRPSAGDIANLTAVDEPVEAGDVLVIDPLTPGRMALARNAADTAVFGVVVADAGVVLGANAANDSTEVPVALSGVVSCKVDASWGAIVPGDLLQSSPTPGHAMRSETPGIGSVLGKALEPLDAGTGTIRILVTLR